MAEIRWRTNPARNSLFVNSLHYKVAEVTIPAPVNTSDVNRVSCVLVSPAVQRSERRSFGRHRPRHGDGRTARSWRPAVLSTGYVYCDGPLNTQVASHFSDSDEPVGDQAFAGMSQVWETGKAGFVAGYMANIPAQWQSLLGGPALTGQCCIPLVTRTSFGPSAFGFDPAGIGANTALPSFATAVLHEGACDPRPLGRRNGNVWRRDHDGRRGGHHRNTHSSSADRHYVLLSVRVEKSALTEQKGLLTRQIATTRGTLPKARMAILTYRSRRMTSPTSPQSRLAPEQPWDVVPSVWPSVADGGGKKIEIGGIAYDAQRQLLYVSQSFADLDGCCERRPIIHTLKLNTPSTIALAPTVSLTPNAAAPQALGT